MLPDPHANKPASSPSAMPSAPVVFPTPTSAHQTLSELTVDQRSRMLRNLTTVGKVVEEFGEDLISTIVKPLQDISPDVLASKKELTPLIQNARDRLVERASRFEFDISDFTSLTELIQDYASAVRTEIATALEMMKQLSEGNSGGDPKKYLHDILITLYRITSLDTNALTPVLLKQIEELTSKDSAA